MTVAQINAAIKNGTVITICPWDSAWTNQASATVLQVSDGRVARYQVDGCECTICRPVSYGTWNAIIAQVA